ncbi:hypothetical protein BU204_09595 [Actinophytocola xanthii]|uniref:Uncharacterized protein n=1 Tax=Actinophytocola xanthii TaxID=1912961 RepID=A0A1Q8CTQ1_9PSEU|nr:hypothetical protein BU204_09595 [Actinophytocola xanthii]
MTRPEPVRYLRTEPTMAYPDGRLLAVRDGQLHVLAPDGWIRLRSTTRPPGTTPLTREEAEDWCDQTGWDLALLDTLPPTGDL